MNAITAEKFIGSWRLQSWTITDVPGDRVSEPFGPRPDGLLIYNEAGWMSACIARADRQQFGAGKSPRTVSDQQLSAAYRSYFHYAGRYRVDGDSIIHSVSMSLNPDFPGTEQVRQYHFDGETLSLSGEEQHADRRRSHKLVWRRDPGR